MDASTNESRTGSGTGSVLDDPAWDTRMSWHEPAPLHLLARHMRDRTWLDIKTDERLWPRVRIVEIRVYARSEDIVVRQEWLNQSDEFMHAQSVIDADAIWKVLPTNYKIEQVTPYLDMLINWEQKAPSEDEVVEVWDAIFEAAAFIFADDGDRLFRAQSGKEEWHITHHRHAIIIVMYEMTDATPLDICKRFKYKSQGPYLLARQKAQGSITGQGWQSKHNDLLVDAARRLGELVDTRFAPVKHRRSGPLYDYKPVLP